MATRAITSPDDHALTELCRALAARSKQLDLTGDWPADQLRLCGEHGVYEWFADARWGGQGWDAEAIVRGYLALSTACLTTTIVLTQREGACRRIESSDNDFVKQKLLPGLTSGELFATVGISHLTTSRRHAARPVLQARRTQGAFVLDGFSAWVTGAAHADYVVVGASVMDGDQATRKQLLAVVPTDLDGVRAEDPARLVALSASHTGQFTLKSAKLDERWVIAGPVEDVMTQGVGAGTGGLQTSTLALGLARSALHYLADEAERRRELGPPIDALQTDYDRLEPMLIAAARGESPCSNEELRQQANSLVLRATQSAMAAAKGAGYVAGHPAGRWCREALFFLVWSCPQPVVAAQMCELAGILE
jgi:alkylation response protein AidB-like acyl-CoA dehydrogenase